MDPKREVKPNGKMMITWEELQKHNVESDCWLAVRGKVYDVTKWIAHHPGGVDTIVLNGGRDATQLFEAYHPTRVYSMLSSYYVADIAANVGNPDFPPMSDFYLSLKKKVENYFVENKLNPRPYQEMLFRTVVLMTMLFSFHYLSVVTDIWAAKVAAALLVGVAASLLSFMPVHEGSHASTSGSPLLWRVMGAVHDFVNGASFYTWCHQHFLGHHPYTNLTTGEAANDALDPDVFTNDPDIRRIKPNQTWYSRYRFQAFYVPLLYGLLGIKYRINDVLIMFVSKTNGHIKLNPPNTWHLVCFILGKAFFVFYRLIVPAYYIGLVNSLLLFLISDLTTGYMLAFVFQVNHVVPVAKWPTVDKTTGRVNMDWAEMQLSTTLDYAHGSYWTTVLTGALNYQVVHHLFPYISQLHYPALALIIKKHCKEHDMPYHCLPSFSAALQEHFRYLSIMGNAHSEF